MSFYVATQSFRNDDGDWIEAGKTYVLDKADVFKKYPSRFKRTEYMIRHVHGDGIERIGAAHTFVETTTRQRAKRPVARSLSSRRPTRPGWQLGPDPRSYRDVQLLERFVDYRVRIGSSAREAILDEIKRAHRAAGQPVEAAGWLFGHDRPRAESNSTTVAIATRSTERSGTRGEVYLSDPFSALATVRADYPRMTILGDWHSHTVHGSELPSRADAIAWAGTMDKLARDAYVSVIVSPSAEQGWMFPRFSAWVTGRHGIPSQPLVGRARIAA